MEYKCIDVNFLKTINSKKLYLYYGEKNNIKKQVQNNINYLPCLIYNDIDYLKLLESEVLIFIDSPKIIYGIIKPINIIIKTLTCEENNKLIVDEKEYNNAINKNSIAEINNLFFIKYEKINKFEYEIKISKFNKFYEKLLSLSNFIIIENTHMKIIDKLLEFIDINNNEINISEINDTNEKYIEYNIPILWNCCNDVRDAIINKKITKKIISTHLQKCINCEIINNNIENINIKNKFVIKILDSKNEIDFFEEIISHYSYATKLYSNKKYINHDKINIFLANNIDNIYSTCLFII